MYKNESMFVVYLHNKKLFDRFWKKYKIVLGDILKL